MIGAPLPLVDPLVVEVISNTAAWEPYLPPLVGFLGSLLVAAVAIYSVLKSNATNERALEAADVRERARWKIDSDREREKWHRDNLLRICSEAVRVSREISHHYNKAGGACLMYADLSEAEDAYQQNMEAAQVAIAKVAPLSYDMTLLGETHLYMEFQEIRQAGEYVAPAFRQFHRYLAANFDRLHPPPGSVLMAEVIRAELHASLGWRRYWKAGQHLTEAYLNFQFAAQKAISPQSLPDNAPSRTEPVITPEKHPDLFYPPPGSLQNIYQRPGAFDWSAGDTVDPVPDN